MVKDGYAGVLCYAPNDSHARAYMKELSHAREGKKGLWGQGYSLSEKWVH